MTFVVAVFIAFAVMVAFQCVVVVPEGSAFVVERIGQYQGTLMPGRHVLVPFIDRVAYRYSLQPSDAEITEQCITSDNVPVRVVSVVRAQIVDPRRAAYGSANAADAVLALVRTRQRQWIGERRWSDVRESTREMEAAVAGAVEELGVEILNVETKQIERIGS